MPKVPHEVINQPVVAISLQHFNELVRIMREANSNLFYLIPSDLGRSTEYHNYLDNNIIRARNILLAYKSK